MQKRSLKAQIRLNLSNVCGWRSKRRIVVIESDDWGSVRTANISAYNNLLEKGFDVDSSHYNRFDCLESNEDLELLLNILSDFKDTKGNSAVITPFCNMGNPDFVSIVESGYKSYCFQPLHLTLQSYPNHDKVLEYWKQGQSERLFAPELHGREHINVFRFINLVSEDSHGFRELVRNSSVGVSAWNGNEFPNYLGALHPENMNEVNEMHNHLKEAGLLFCQYLGRKPQTFVAPNAEEPKELEKTLREIGVKIINRAKFRRYPLGDGTYTSEFNWLGKTSSFGMIYLIRNCFFEPVSTTYGKIDWVDRCLNDINTAFKWGKPAIISSHRVNYVGSLDKRNRDNGLSELRRLIRLILFKWPDVEFVTSSELGKIISNT